MLSFACGSRSNRALEICMSIWWCMLRTSTCRRPASSSSRPRTGSSLWAALPRTASPISAMVASGVRSSCAMMPMVVSVWSSCSRRRLADDTPSSMPMLMQNESTITLTQTTSALMSGSGGPNRPISRRARPSPSRMPTVARRQSVLK